MYLFFLTLLTVVYSLQHNETEVVQCAGCSKFIDLIFGMDILWFCHFLFFLWNNACFFFFFCIVSVFSTFLSTLTYAYFLVCDVSGSIDANDLQNMKDGIMEICRGKSIKYSLINNHLHSCSSQDRLLLLSLIFLSYLPTYLLFLIHGCRSPLLFPSSLFLFFALFNSFDELTFVLTCLRIRVWSWLDKCWDCLFWHRISYCYVTSIWY